MSKFLNRTRLLVLAAAALMMGSAQAHRQWVLPSSTNLSAKEAWVTFDAAVSNEIFIFEHNAAALDGLGGDGPRWLRSAGGKPLQGAVSQCL